MDPMMPFKFGRLKDMLVLKDIPENVQALECIQNGTSRIRYFQPSKVRDMKYRKVHTYVSFVPELMDKFTLMTATTIQDLLLFLFAESNAG